MLTCRLLPMLTLLLLAGADAFSNAAAAAADAPQPPNFVIINIDDLGYADIGPFGSKLNRTPHLDRLAAEGMKLTSFYAAPVCSPSRASLMTGCYPKRVGIPGVLFPGQPGGISSEEHTLAELLKQRGYATACIGKWHLGDQPEFLPRRHGFDYYYGLPYSNDMGPAEEGARSSLGDPLPKTPAAGKRGHPPLPLVRNEQVIERIRAEQQTTLVARYTDEAVKFMRQNADKRFFLYLPHNAVHFPIYPGKAFQGKSANGIYGDWVEEVDWSVGQVVAAIRQLKLDRQTLVLFTSDNGGTPRAVNAPLRGFKGSTWEGGMREPTIAWWPGKIPAGSSCSAVTCTMDVLPTFVGLVGGSVPGDRVIDGKDIWPLLSGKTTQSPREAFFYFHGTRLEAVRSGPWKLAVAAQQQPQQPRGKKKQAGAAAKAQPRLYNLEQDIGETTDVAAGHPEVVRRLQGLVASMAADLGADAPGPGCRQPGRVEGPRPLIDYDGTIREGFAPSK